MLTQPTFSHLTLVYPGIIMPNTGPMTASERWAMWGTSIRPVIAGASRLGTKSFNYGSHRPSLSQKKSGHQRQRDGLESVNLPFSITPRIDEELDVLTRSSHIAAVRFGKSAIWESEIKCSTEMTRVCTPAPQCTGHSSTGLSLDAQAHWTC